MTSKKPDLGKVNIPSLPKVKRATVEIMTDMINFATWASTRNVKNNVSILNISKEHSSQFRSNKKPTTSFLNKELLHFNTKQEPQLTWYKSSILGIRSSIVTKNPYFTKKRKVAEKQASTKQVKNISPDNLKKMPLDELCRLPEREIEELTEKQLIDILIGRSWILTEEQIQKISSKEIAELSPKCIHDMSPRILQMMSNDQFCNMTPNQIKAMRPLHMCVLTKERLTAFTEQQILALQPSQVAAMNSDQIFTLITSGKLGSMNARQFYRMPEETRNRLRNLKSQLFPRKKRKVTKNHEKK